MKLPKTTPDKPYIEIRITKKSTLKLKPASLKWGGKNGGFFCSDGSIGNVCEPHQVKEYFVALANKQIAENDKKIKKLQAENERIQSLKQKTLKKLS